MILLLPPLFVFGYALTKGLGCTSGCSLEVAFLFFLVAIGLF